MENIKETIAKLEKGLDNPYITDDIKVKISEKIAELKAELEPKPEVKVGDLISFKVSMNADAKTLEGVVDYKDQLGFITVVDGVQYELRKLIDIEILDKKPEVEVKVEPTLDDLTKRLAIVTKMVKKDPNLKARVKIIEKMIEKAKINQQNNDFEVVFASDDSILISDGNKIIKWNFTGEKEEFKDENFFKTLKNTLTFDVVKANSFDDAYNKIKKTINMPQNITETIGYKIVKALGGFGDGSGDEKAILDSYSDIIPQLTKAATEPFDRVELQKLIMKITGNPDVSSDLEILRKHKVLDLGKFESRIYRAADRMTDEEFKDLSETLSKEETKTYESLIRLGDEPKLALATVLDKREVVNNKTAAEPIKELYLKEISTRAGVRKEAVNEFAIANGLTNQDMLTIVQGLGRGMLAPQDFVTAIVGNDRGRKSYTKKVLDFIKSGKAWKVEKKPTTEKLYSIQNNIGKSKYVVNYHDGVKTHKDGSAFYDIKIFKNKKDFENFIKKIESEGYEEKYEQGGEINELKISDLKKGDLLKKKGSALEVEVLEVGNDWRSGHDYAIIETPFGEPTRYIDVSNYVLSDGSPKPQFEQGGEVDDNKTRFDVDFYKSLNDRHTSYETILRSADFTKIIENAVKIAKEKAMDYIEIYNRNNYIGSMKKKDEYAFKNGQNWDKNPIKGNYQKDYKYEQGGEVSANIASIRGLIKKAVDGKEDRTTVEKGNYRIDMVYDYGVLNLSFYYLDYNHPRFNPDVVHYANFTYENNKGTLELFDKDVYNKKGERVNIKPLIEKTIEALNELDYSVDEIIDENEEFGDGGEVSLILGGYEYQMISSPTMSYLKKSYKEELKNTDYAIIELPASHPDRKRGNKFGLFKKPKMAKGGSTWIQKATKQMEKKGTKGLFTERAEARGLTAVEFAKKVLANPNRYTKTIQKEAQFVKNTNPELFN